MNGPGHSTRLRLAGLHPPLLRPVDLSVAAGETLALHGPSGAGKSLLLRAIADLDPNAGEAFLDGVPRSTFTGPDWRRAVMLVPAESHWWDDRVRPHAEHWDMELLAALGFDADVLDWQTPRLSSGERQRLALVRALGLRPPVLLLDEVTANLDDGNTGRVEALLRDYQQGSGAAILWVSHDPAQRARVAERRAFVGDGAVSEEPR
jgi:ABC-type iron transport system FetAB ATPase subunit